jgi:hypothetical protein
MTIGNRTNSALGVLLIEKQLSHVFSACETLGNVELIYPQHFSNILIFVYNNRGLHTSFAKLLRAYGGTGSSTHPLRTHRFLQSQCPSREALTNYSLYLTQHHPIQASLYVTFLRVERERGG